MDFIAAALLLIYTLVIGWLWSGWRSIPVFQPNNAGTTRLVTIIVPYRNEEHGLEATIRSLMRQSYPSHLYEVLCVDDGSDDGSHAIVERLRREFPNLQSLQLTSGQGKKSAIAEGIVHATGNLLATLDADVTVGPNWLSRLAEFQRRSHHSMVVMPLTIRKEESIWSRWQSLELLALTGTAAASARRRHPVLCNGANLAFTRDAFIQVHGFSGNEHISSGDDMFLLFKLKAVDPKLIGYLHHPEAIGYTAACTSGKELLDQRVRWASKTAHYTDRDAFLLAMIVWLAHAAFLYEVATLVFPGGSWLAPASLITARILVDFVFLRDVATFYSKRTLLRSFPSLILIYSFYVVCIPLIGLFYRPRWKGRTIDRTPTRTPQYAH